MVKGQSRVSRITSWTELARNLCFDDPDRKADRPVKLFPVWVVGTLGNWCLVSACPASVRKGIPFSSSSGPKRKI